MKNHLIGVLMLTIMATGLLSASPLQAYYQGDLLAEYEQRLILIEKQFTEYKKQIDPKKMAAIDVKMKVGDFENHRNSLKAKIKDLRKAATPISETDQGDLDKRFEELTKDFEELKKIAG